MPRRCAVGSNLGSSSRRPEKMPNSAKGTFNPEVRAPVVEMLEDRRLMSAAPGGHHGGGFGARDGGAAFAPAGLTVQFSQLSTAIQNGLSGLATAKR